MHSDFRRLAIVNRGEPAMRLIHAVRELNAVRDDPIRTIALFTEPDRNAMFVREADESYALGTPTFVVAGRGEPNSLSSCSHGAGRRLSRSEAKRKISSKQLHASMGGVWFDVRRQHALREEAPSAYKDIQQVMRDQRELVRIVAQHRPLLSFKGN